MVRANTTRGTLTTGNSPTDFTDLHRRNEHESLESHEYRSSYIRVIRVIRVLFFMLSRHFVLLPRPGNDITSMM